MQRAIILLSAVIGLFLLGAPAPAYANSYAQFSNTRLFCVVSPGGNYLSTIPVSGAVKNYTVATLLSDAKRTKRKARALLAGLKARLKSTPKRKKAKVRAQIQATQNAIALIDSITVFTKQCGDHVLDSLASPFLPGGGGGKR